MRHKILENPVPKNPYFYISVELLPDNVQEIEAIKKVESMEATEEQNEFVTNYLHFGLKLPYSILGVIKQKNTHFILKATAQ